MELVGNLVYYSADSCHVYANAQPNEFNNYHDECAVECVERAHRITQSKAKQIRRVTSSFYYAIQCCKVYYTSGVELTPSDVRAYVFISMAFACHLPYILHVLYTNLCITILYVCRCICILYTMRVWHM